MAGPSGRRSVTEESLKKSAVGNGGGSGGSASEQSQSADGDARNSQEQSGTAESQNGGQSQGGQQGTRDDGRQPGESDTSQSTSGDLTPDESAEYAALKDKYLKKEQDYGHAEKKITQQGQELSESRKRESELGDRVAKLETVLTKILAGTDTDQDQDGTASYGADLGLGDDESQSNGNARRNNGDDPMDQRLAALEEVVGGMYVQQKEIGNTVTGITSAQQQAEQIGAIRGKLGVDEETASVLLEASKGGDVVEVARILELKTQPAESRRLAREQRERQRESVFQPGSTSTPSEMSEADQAAATGEAEKIMDMDDGIGKQRAIEKFLDQHPGNFEALRAASGFNIGGNFAG